MSLMKNVVRIAEVKYPKAEGRKHMWIFNHSSCHGAKADDSLNVSKMNVIAGGEAACNETWLVGKRGG